MVQREAVEGHIKTAMTEEREKKVFNLIFSYCRVFTRTVTRRGPNLSGRMKSPSKQGRAAFALSFSSTAQKAIEWHESALRSFE